MMKHFSLRSLLSGLLILFPWRIQAQVAAPEKAAEAFRTSYAFGLKAGKDFSQVNFNPAVQQKFTPGYTAGIVFKYLSLPKAGMQVELNYIRRGWTAVADSNSRQWQYLELPLMTHVAFGKRKSKFILNFGPTFSFLLSARDTITLVTERFNRQANYKNVPRPFQYGLSLGVGFSRQTPVGQFQLEGRFGYSLANALEGKSFSTSQYQVLGLSLIYFLEIKKQAPKSGRPPGTQQ
jgi:hypothetical protein